jgi:hypothetical protein
MASAAIEPLDAPFSSPAAVDSILLVRRWKYRPATLNGRAVRVRLSVTVSFRLH